MLYRLSHQGSREALEGLILVFYPQAGVGLRVERIPRQQVWPRSSYLTWPGLCVEADRPTWQGAHLPPPRGLSATGQEIWVHLTLPGHVGAAGGHPRHVTGGRWRRRPVRQRRRLVHGRWAGRRRDLDLGEVAGFHGAWRLGLTQSSCEGWLPVCGGETGHWPAQAAASQAGGMWRRGTPPP